MNTIAAAENFIYMYINHNFFYNGKLINSKSRCWTYYKKIKNNTQAHWWIIEYHYIGIKNGLNTIPDLGKITGLNKLMIGTKTIN